MGVFADKELACGVPDVPPIPVTPVIVDCSVPGSPEPIPDCPEVDVSPDPEVPCADFTGTGTLTVSSTATPAVVVTITELDPPDDCNANQCRHKVDVKVTVPGVPAVPEFPASSYIDTMTQLVCVRRGDCQCLLQSMKRVSVMGGKIVVVALMVKDTLCCFPLCGSSSSSSGSSSGGNLDLWTPCDSGSGSGVGFPDRLQEPEVYDLAVELAGVEDPVVVFDDVAVCYRRVGPIQSEQPPDWFYIFMVYAECGSGECSNCESFCLDGAGSPETNVRYEFLEQLPVGDGVVRCEWTGTGEVEVRVVSYHNVGDNTITYYAQRYDAPDWIDLYSFTQTTVGGLTATCRCPAVGPDSASEEWDVLAGEPSGPRVAACPESSSSSSSDVRDAWTLCSTVSGSPPASLYLSREEFDPDLPTVYVSMTVGVGCYTRFAQNVSPDLTEGVTVLAKLADCSACGNRRYVSCPAEGLPDVVISPALTTAEAIKVGGACYVFSAMTADEVTETSEPDAEYLNCAKCQNQVCDCDGAAIEIVFTGMPEDYRCASCQREENPVPVMLGYSGNQCNLRWIWGDGCYTDVRAIQGFVATPVCEALPHSYDQVYIVYRPDGSSCGTVRISLTVQAAS